MKMKEKQIMVIIKEPGQAPRVEPLFDNTLEAFQKAVGGYIEAVNLDAYTTLIVNEEGILLGLPFNPTNLAQLDLFGPIVALGRKGTEFCSLRGSCVSQLLRLLSEPTKEVK